MPAKGPHGEERAPRLDERLQLLIDAVGDALIAATLDGRVVGCNQSACQLLGYSRAEMFELSRTDIVVDDERLREVVRVREQAGSSRGVVTLLRKGGERFEGEAKTFETRADGEPRVWIVIHDLSDRVRAEQATAALRESNEILRALTDAAFEPIVIHRDGVILMSNRAGEILARVPEGGLVGKRLFDFIAPQEHARIVERIQQKNEDPYESVGQRADGTQFACEVQVRVGPVNVNGEPARVAAFRDITERKKLEEEARHAQKMEAIGRLAGGVAHDFNNLLSVIVGAVGLAAAEIEPGHPAHAALEDVRRASERAAELTQKLLAFGRKQVLKMRAIDVNRALTDMESMIRTFVGATVKLDLVLEPGLGTVLADPSQFELMLLNLVANARDAMPQGGALVIATQSAALDAAEALRLGTLPGPHAKISVSDEGFGMDEATKERIFEPFFTTKGPGRGTGLGLPTVFGIVKQSQGTVSVESQPGRGSKLIVSLPLTSQPLRSESDPPPSSAHPSSKRTIWVVEDEPDVRRVIVQVLLRKGYVVHEFGAPEAALAELHAGKQEFDLLLTDVLMPNMSGRQLADRMRSSRPLIAVLYMSGYADKAFDEGLDPADAENFLPKPFTPDRLVAAIEKALARGA
jgi:two-component system, cell cycle sensor histidine kinase and response regulator CckA